MSDRIPPSSLRIPLTVLLVLTVPPLAIVAWIVLSGSQRGDYLRSKWVQRGIAVVVITTAPLLTVGAAAALGLTSDPNPNPIGLGLLMFAGATLGTLLVVTGVVVVSRRGA